MTHLYTISYKKALGKNYMILEPDTSAIENNSDAYTDNFRIRMIQENNIAGYLNTHVQYIDDIPSFQYDITGMQSLSVLLDTTPLTYPLLAKIFLSLYNNLLSAENYLLSPDHILLEPDYIYISADYSDIRLCYYPLYSGTLMESIRLFFDYLLKKVNHSDEKCTYLAYSMHRF